MAYDGCLYRVLPSMVKPSPHRGLLSVNIRDETWVDIPRAKGWRTAYFIRRKSGKYEAESINQFRITQSSERNATFAVNVTLTFVHC